MDELHRRSSAWTDGPWSRKANATRVGASNQEQAAEKGSLMANGSR